MMSNHKWLAVLFLCTFLLGACTVTGPSDDGFESDNEWVDNGRLFTDAQKTIYKSPQKQAPTQPSASPNQPGLAVLDEKTEFEQFKLWNELRAKGTESEEYQEFLLWLNYQTFKTK